MRPSLYLAACLCVTAYGSSVLVTHNDSNQTGWNSAETVLAPSVVSADFGLIGSYTVDGDVWAQPLYVPGVMVGGQSRNLLIVATNNNSLYAFDADSPGTAAIWKATLSGSPRTSYPDTISPTVLYNHPVGVLGTPAIDLMNGLIYVVNTNTTPTWVLSKVSLTSGTVLATATITGSVTGTGDPTGGDTVTGGVLSFYPAYALQRPGLVIANSKVYVAFGSYDDAHPWHGWLFAYNTSDLSQAGIFCTSPNTYGAAIWQSGGAPVVDGSGNLYVTTGNDSFDGVTAWGETTLKLSPTLALLDWFAPSNYATLDAADEDVSSNRPILIPGTTKLLVTGKDFNVYVIDTTCMGHVGGTANGCTAPQTWKTSTTFGANNNTGANGWSFANNTLVIPVFGSSSLLQAYQWNGTQFNTTPAATISYGTTYGQPGPSTLAISSDGTASSLVWVITASGNTHNATQPGTLHALDLGTLAEYWNSGSTLGTFAKFSAPTIANGRVYVATLDNRVQVYGVLGIIGPVSGGRAVHAVGRSTPSPF